MGTEITVTMGHNLSEGAQLSLVDSLNAHFERHSAEIRFRRQLTGEVVDLGDRWVWNPNSYPESANLDSRHSGPVEPGLWSWRTGFGDTGMPSIRGLYSGEWWLKGPFCLTLWVGKRAVHLDSDVHWEYFIFDPIFQPDFRRLAQLIAHFFGSPFAIYVPDDIEPWCYADEHVHAGESLSEIREWLATITPPARDFTALIETVLVDGQRCTRARGFFVDDFKDLPTIALLTPEPSKLVPPLLET